MKSFKVKVTPKAMDDIRKYINYIRDVKHNLQAARNVLKDFKNTQESLSLVAESLALPESEILKSRNLKRMNFLHHNYFLLYYIGTDNVVYITDVFHGSENFESKLK